MLTKISTRKNLWSDQNVKDDKIAAVDEKIDADESKAAAALCKEVISNLKGPAEDEDHDKEQIIEMQEKLILACEKVQEDPSETPQAKLEAMLQRIRAKASLITLVDDSYDLEDYTGDEAAQRDLAFI